MEISMEIPQKKKTKNKYLKGETLRLSLGA